ncbi:DUF4180 domain-containing protein [Lentzea tibetensis]|uniref:DUF4180 domain-containing protein n=1 Tax=Lentzea tibetensis TaxID=2591470 RepID=A0A563EQ30_9PSEU|nr:DUF4180 domain-containing protein [Lentzea tibetensis]TWP49507.1 DUF4180 domain-containing protein [Lentzea tibetensis]
MLQTLHGVSTYVVPADSAKLDGEQAVVDLIGQLWGQDVDLVVVPAERLTDDFFRLRTGVAGAIVQKFVNYGLRVAVVGDISGHVEASTSLRDFVHESNRRTQLWFVRDEAELHERLANA